MAVSRPPKTLEPASQPSPRQDPAQPAPPPSNAPQIPGYRIEAVIGRGSAGTVYRAVQLAIDRKVALKVLHPELATRGRAVRRLQREARTTARLSHPGIVTAIDMGVTGGGAAGGLWWYAMELVDGPSLAEKLKADGALAERDAIRLFIPLCEALEHAFEHGVVHRDLKPGNILIDSGQRARIVDLGLAFAEDDPALTMQGGTLGTPHYISPEQARNPKNADVRSDIWSLGATLYHCVCGRPPFSGASVAEILSGVLYAPVPDPVEFAPELGKALRLVIRKCLARDPARRYQHPRELRQDLEAIRERRAISVRRSTLEPVRGEKEMRRRMLAIGLGVAALASGIALVAWKPWAGSAGGAGVVRAPEPDARLERIADLAQRREGVALALDQLERIARDVRPEHQARADELRRDLRARHELAIAELRNELDGEMLRRKGRDYAGMLAWIDEVLPVRLKVQLGASPAQIEDIERRLDVAAKREQVEKDMDRALLELYDRASRQYAEQRVAQRSVAARTARKWRTARAELAVGGADLIAESGLPTDGFPPERLAVVAEQLDTLVAKAVANLEQEWTLADNRKSIEIARVRQELLDELEQRLTLEGVGELERRWRQNVHYLEGEDLPGLGGASEAALAKARRDLAEVEGRIRAEDARGTLARLVVDLEPEWRARKYDVIAERLDELVRLPALEPVRADLELLQIEAKLLEGVLRRAAARIESAAASSEEIELYFGSLPRVGRIVEAHQPFVRGFRFRPNDSPTRSLQLALRELPSGEGQGALLSRHAVEQLAGLGAAEPPRLGLETALFRWRSGDRQAALDLRPALREPAEAGLARLFSDLRVRLDRDELASQIATEERVAEAIALLKLIRRARKEPSATPRKQAEWIEDLQRRFGDLPEISAVADELRKRRQELDKEIDLSDREHLQKTYGPTELELPSPSTVAMRWVFDARYRGAFLSESWKTEAEGWIALSVAGVHVVFVAPTHANHKGRYLVGSGTPDGDFDQLLRDALDQPKGGRAFDGFRKGDRYRIRLELENGRGQVAIFVNGVELSTETVRKPDPASYGGKMLLIRSIEPVRILEARLNASRD